MSSRNPMIPLTLQSPVHVDPVADDSTEQHDGAPCSEAEDCGEPKFSTRQMYKI